MKEPTSIIYPYIAASGVTMLKQRGFDVKFMDCPTENKNFGHVLQEVKDSDVVVLEARTPIMNYIWKCCERIKDFNPNVKTILYGDHVTAFPIESVEKEGVDFIAAGGDYDLSVLHVCDALSHGTMIWHRVQHELLYRNLDELPFVDRELVNWKNYYEAWRHRDKFFWTMSGRGCTYNCTFCAWVKCLWNNTIRLRSPNNVARAEMLRL